MKDRRQPSYRRTVSVSELVRFALRENVARKRCPAVATDGTTVRPFVLMGVGGAEAHAGSLACVSTAASSLGGCVVARVPFPLLHAASISMMTRVPAGPRIAAA